MKRRKGCDILELYVNGLFFGRGFVIFGGMNIDIILLNFQQFRLGQVIFDSFQSFSFVYVLYYCIIVLLYVIKF